eukprot:7211171-Ditylum_brightwellii.AAC.1
MHHGSLKIKFGPFFGKVKSVIKVGGSGSHKGRHTIGTGIEKTTNIVYTLVVNSITQLLSEGKNVDVPCNEFVQRQFLCLMKKQEC